jgi:hypothetical protein
MWGWQAWQQFAHGTIRRSIVKRILNVGLLLSVIAGWVPFAMGQQAPLGKDDAGIMSASGPTQCTYQFVVNNKKHNYLYYCLTTAGTIAGLGTADVNNFVLAVLSGSEGYGICTESPATAYWDYGSDGNSGNWKAPVLLNQTKTSVQISRTTADDVWTLTQTFTLDLKTPAVKIAMTLKNNASKPLVAYLVRYGNYDPNDLAHLTIGNVDATAQSALGWTSTTGAIDGAGLILQNVDKPVFSYFNGFAQNTPHGPNPCAFAFNSPGGPLVGIDGSLVLAYADSFQSGQSRTATMMYRGM